MKVFVTKYCLTDGITEAEGDINSSGYFISKSRLNYLFLNKKEYFLKKEDAIANAEERRIKKLQSLDKQTKKISALKFS